MVVYSVVETVLEDNNLVVRNVVSSGINILIILIMMFVGKSVASNVLCRKAMRRHSRSVVEDNALRENTGEVVFK